MSLAVCALAGCGTTGSDRPPAIATTSGPQTRPHVQRGVIAYVSDGDTVGVRVDGRVVRVRLVGINAPESKDPDIQPQCFGPEAGAIATRLMPPGMPVTVVTDPTQDRIDRYGRLLAYVFERGRARTVNELLVREGAAVVYIYRASRPPARLTELRSAERFARAARRGLWGACPPG